jgi:S1-C subfamily serine protease
MTSASDPDLTRVAELIVTFPDGHRTRGSGYRTSDTAVLTAAHVVEHASEVRVRFESDLPGEWEVVTTSWWLDASADLALLAIDGPAVTSAQFGRPLTVLPGRACPARRCG